MSIKGIEMVSIHDEIIDGEVYLKVLEEKILPLMNMSRVWSYSYIF